MAEDDATKQMDNILERAQAGLEAGMYVAAKELYLIAIRQTSNSGRFEEAALLARKVSDDFRKKSIDDVADQFSAESTEIYGRIEANFQSQIKSYDEIGKPDIAAQIAFRAKQVFERAGYKTQAETFGALAATYLEMCRTFFPISDEPQ